MHHFTIGKGKRCESLRPDMVVVLKAISLSSLALMVLAIPGLCGSDSLFSFSPAVIGVQCLAVALMIWARLTFGLRSFHPAANPTRAGGGTRN
jgi:hypothetical protein